MAKPKTEHDLIEQQIYAAIEKMMPRIEGLDDARKEMAERELYGYYWCYFKCQELRQQVDDEGMTKVDQKGREIENPKLNMIHKLSGRQSEMFSKIMRWLPKGDADDTAAGLIEFVNA